MSNTASLVFPLEPGINTIPTAFSEKSANSVCVSPETPEQPFPSGVMGAVWWAGTRELPGEGRSTGSQLLLTAPSLSSSAGAQTQGKKKQKRAAANRLCCLLLLREECPANFLFSPNFPLEIGERKGRRELHPQGEAELLDRSWGAPGITSWDSHPDPQPWAPWHHQLGLPPRSTALSALGRRGWGWQSSEGRRICSSWPCKY